MTEAIRPRSQNVRLFILKHVQSERLAARVSQKFAITRQAANKHLRKLVDEGAIVAAGATQNRTYKLANGKIKDFRYKLRPGLEEDVVWRTDIRPLLENLPGNVVDVWHWAFTEMFNNAIDHSEGTFVYVEVKKTAITSEIMIMDDGVGIFQKLRQRFDLDDERQALLELSKGKLTTDPSKHSGQGIFFTSRMVNSFRILSGKTYFSHEIQNEEDWLIEKSESRGTTVFMKVDNHTARTTRKILDQFSVGGSYGFNKTIVPVELARYGTDQLISRSQAKRVLARVDQFAQVLLDFSGVEEIGQAFGDEVFRVFPAEHPETKLLPIHANKTIMGIYQAILKTGKPGYKGQKSAGA